MNIIIKPDGQIVKKEETDKNKNAFKFDWVPPNVHKDLASEYMQQLPSDKLPISGSEGALFRRQQLEKQVPLHDFNANICHNLSTEESDAMSSYLENLKENAVGQGLVKKLSNSANPLPLFNNMNITPKPFKNLFKQEHVEDEEFLPPPPPELLYTPNPILKKPSTFIGNKNYSNSDKFESNMLDNANNNPAVSHQQVTSQWPSSKIAWSETLPQQPTNFSSNIKNDNYKPEELNDHNVSKLSESPSQERSNDPQNQKIALSDNADTYVVHDGKELLCKQCNLKVLPGQVAVMAERTGKEVLWHPPCFVCSTCEVMFIIILMQYVTQPCFLYYLFYLLRNY